MNDSIHIEWVKNCVCAAGAKTGQIVTKTEDRGAEGIFITTTFYPMPICDACKTPWVKPETRPAQEGAQ